MPQDSRVLLPIRCIRNSMDALLRKGFFSGVIPHATWTELSRNGSMNMTVNSAYCPVTRFQSNWASAGWDWTFGVEIYFQSTWCYCGKHWSQHWLASLWNPFDKMWRLLPNKLTLWRGQDEMWIWINVILQVFVPSIKRVVETHLT